MNLLSTLVLGVLLAQSPAKATIESSVSGHVKGSNGTPVPGMQVTLIRQVYSATGQLGRATEGTAVTNDRGEYRIFAVPPGDYLASVDNETYYPGTADASRAAVVHVDPATGLNNIDVVVTPTATYSIRGKVIDGETGKPAQDFSVGLSQHIDAGSSVEWTRTEPKYTSTVNRDTGTFEIRGVFPGSYWLRATKLECGDCLLDLPDNPDDLLRYLTDLANGRQSSVIFPSRENPPGTQTKTDVSGSDTEGVVLTLAPNISLPVQLSFDGQNIPALNGVDSMRVTLPPIATGAAIIDGQLTRAKGFSAFYKVAPGEYRLNLVSTLSGQPDLFVKEARLGGRDVLDSSFVVTSSSNETLNIVLSNKGGQVDGTLLDSRSNPRSGIPVVLIPDQQRDRPELYKNATSDQDGHFSFRGIAPGAYKVFAWEAIESFSYWNKDVLSQYERQGQPVRIQESMKERVEVRIIPALK